jgi:hypothetical protein
MTTIDNDSWICVHAYVEISKKLLCFGVDGVTVFQGSKIGVTKQIKGSHAPFFMGVHCVAHCINLVV